MIETIKTFLTETVGAYWSVFFCSMLPVIELRGAIPLGSVLGVQPLLCYAIAVAGNLLPVPFILLLIRWVLEGMKRIPGVRRVAFWLEEKAEKNRAKVERYAFWGLLLFVAVPLPGTGAWTGALVAALMGMRFSKAMLSITGGVLIAGAVITAASYGVVAVISAWF